MRNLLLLVWLCVAGCMPFVGITGEIDGPVGNTSNGVITEVVQLDPETDSYRFYHKRDRKYGTPQLAALIENSAGRVSECHESGVLLVGDMSGPHGGYISGHRSHRTGMDVDLAFYSSTTSNVPVVGFPLAKYDRFGIAMRSGAIQRFDLAKNWELVEALLSDEQARVQWIFVSKGLKARLLSWALHNGKDIEIVAKAADVLHQPGDSSTHNDHFHVRIFCPEGERGAGCQQVPPVWSWAKNDPQVGGAITDDELVRMATEGL